MAAGAGMTESFFTETAEKDDAEAFPKFRHPSFVQHATDQVRQQTIVVQDTEDVDTASHRRRVVLIEQAEVRAEQQALARVTMLDLARELEEASKARKELYVQLLEERQEKERFKAQADATQARLDEALQAVEDAKVAHMQDKLKAATLSGSSLSAAVLWSRRAVHLDHLGEGMTDEERARDLELQPAIERNDTEVGSKWKAVQLACSGKRSRGDGITVLWIVRAWHEQIKNGKLQRQQGNEHLERIAQLEAEMKRMREGLEGKLAAEKANSRALETRLQALLDELEKLKARCEALEKEKLELVQQFCGGGGKENPFEALKRKCAEMEKTIADKDAEIASLHQTIRDLEAAMARQKEEFEEEKRRLRAQIRELSAELQRQIVFAKHLRDVALKAKRDAAGSISPEKMAQLIADLEDMRDRLTWLGSEADRERNSSSILRMKLDNNNRRLDLERQFLPLLHKVRGPVGPKHPLLQKQAQSQSTGALDNSGSGRMGSRQELPGINPSR